jgi:hypothetical protein
MVGSTWRRRVSSSRAVVDSRLVGLEAVHSWASSDTRRRPAHGSIHTPRRMSVSTAERKARASPLVLKLIAATWRLPLCQ